MKRNISNRGLMISKRIKIEMYLT